MQISVHDNSRLSRRERERESETIQRQCYSFLDIASELISPRFSGAAIPLVAGTAKKSARGWANNRRDRSGNQELGPGWRRQTTRNQVVFLNYPWLIVPVGAKFDRFRGTARNLPVSRKLTRARDVSVARAAGERVSFLRIRRPVNARRSLSWSSLSLSLSLSRARARSARSVG